MPTILHVDGSSFYRKVLHKKFVEHGYHYLEANDTTEAMEFLKNETIHIIFTALEFAEQDSAAFVKSLNHKDFKNIPVYVISSSDSDQKKKDFFSLGIVDYIPKATSPDDIVSFVQNSITKDKLIEKMETLAIAVVDDSKLVLNMIKKIFDVHHIYCVDCFTNQEDMFNKKEDYDIYIIDFVLENSTGEQVVRKIRQSNKNAIIIIISSIDNSKIVANVLSCGADDFVFKPFNADVFMARLKTNVRSYYLLKELEKKEHILKELQSLLPKD